jgi:hypothetical protein
MNKTKMLKKELHEKLISAISQTLKSVGKETKKLKKLIKRSAKKIAIVAADNAHKTEVKAQKVVKSVARKTKAKKPVAAKRSKSPASK